MNILQKAIKDLETTIEALSQEPAFAKELAEAYVKLAKLYDSHIEGKWRFAGHGKRVFVPRIVPNKRHTHLPRADFGRPHPKSESYARKQAERAKEVVLDWPKKTRPLKAETIQKTLDAIRQHPEKKAEILALLRSTIKPGVEYTHNPL